MIAAAAATALFAGETKPEDPDAKRPYSTNSWELVWNDEFNGTGLPAPQFWSYEAGFVRNHYYDGRQYGRTRVARGDWPDGQNPFRKPHFLILNLALGGYGNAVSEKSVFPMEFKVDYVRYYRKTN